MNPALLLQNMKAIAAKMDADMRTVQAFMQFVKQKFSDFETRLVALETTRPVSMGGYTPNAARVSPDAVPAHATVTVKRNEVFYGPSEDAVFTSGEGDE